MKNELTLLGLILLVVMIIFIAAGVRDMWYILLSAAMLVVLQFRLTAKE